MNKAELNERIRIARGVLSGEIRLSDLPGDFRNIELDKSHCVPKRIVDGDNYIEIFSGRITLNLKDKEYKPVRRLGTYSVATKMFYVQRSNKKNHVHFNTGKCFGFNYSVLSYLETVGIETLVVRYGKKKLQKKILNILIDGKFKYYKGNHLDRQIFYPVADFDRIK